MNKITIKDRSLALKSQVGDFYFHEKELYRMHKVYSKKVIIRPATEPEKKLYFDYWRDRFAKEKREKYLNELKETNPSKYEKEMKIEELEIQRNRLKFSLLMSSIFGFNHQNDFFSPVRVKGQKYGDELRLENIEKEIEKLEKEL